MKRVTEGSQVAASTTFSYDDAITGRSITVPVHRIGTVRHASGCDLLVDYGYSTPTSAVLGVDCVPVVGEGIE